MMMKYPIHKVAKDFKKGGKELPSKEVMDILTKYNHPPKNHMQPLTEQELSIVFEYLTQHNQISGIQVIYADAEQAVLDLRIELAHLLTRLAKALLHLSAENGKDGFWFSAELAEYIDNNIPLEKRYAVLVYAIRYGLRIAEGADELAELEKVIRAGQLALYRGSVYEEEIEETENVE